MSRLVTLGEVLRHRKGSIIIDDAVEYKRCRVQLHRRGVEVRDIVSGTVIRTKKQQLCKTGDFIVAEMDAKFGGYGFLNESLDGAIVSSHYYLFEVITDRMLPEYLAVINKTDILQNQIKAKGSTNYSAVRPVDVLGWTIPLPSLAEQQRIIDEVEVTEKEQQLLLPEFDQQLTHLTQLRQALLREAMQGQLLPQDPTDEPAALLLKKLQAAKAATGKGGKGKTGALFAEEAEAVEGSFEIPESWVWCKLGDTCSWLNGYAFKSEWFKPKGTRLLRNINMKVGAIDWTDSACLPAELTEDFSQFSLNAGDIVLSLDRPIISGGLKVAQISDSDLPCLLLQRVLRIEPGFTLATDFLFLFLKSFLFVDYISPGRSIGIPHISHKEVMNALLPLPPLAEQHRIVAKLEQFMQHCDALEQRIRESRRLAEQLLQTALREALASPAGTEPAVEAEAELAEVEPASPAPRRGRPLKKRLAANAPDLFSELADLFGVE